MAPARLRKQKSDESTGAIQSRSIQMKATGAVRTPERQGSQRVTAVITAAQKQALIDNLQLEGIRGTASHHKKTTNIRVSN
jgi:hypothetical protein